MKPIRFTRHASEQSAERGAEQSEVIDAIQRGSREPAKSGRILCRANLEFDRIWQGQRYSIKQVAPVIKEELNEIVVVTVYTFYF